MPGRIGESFPDRNRKRRLTVPLLAILALAAPLLAGDAASHATRVRAAMQASLSRQRISLARQSRAPRALLRLRCEPVAAPALAHIIGAAAQRHGLDPNLVREVARQESAFHPCAVSGKGAQGVMQLMPATQAFLHVRNPFDPRESIDAGARLLKQLLDRYRGNLALALSAYNAGPARVDPILAIPPIPETRDYVSRILAQLAAPRP
jgi:soluble lytic murein transglycosylase-like protein